MPPAEAPQIATHIVLDDRGRPWIQGTNTKVLEVVVEQLAWGWSPEEIHRHHPHLPLAKIYAAFSYYYDHQDAMDAELEREHAEFDAFHNAASDSPLRRRLRRRGVA